MCELTDEEFVFKTQTDLAETLANVLCSSVVSEQSEGTSSLPMLDKPDLLLEMMQKPYLKNLDIFEVYCRQCIFSLDMYSSKERRAIVELIKHDESPNDNAAGDQMEEDNDTLISDEAMGLLDWTPPMNQPPSTDVLHSLNDATESLDQKQRLLEYELEALRGEVREWNAAVELVPLLLVNGEQLHQSVSATAIGREGLDDFCQKNLALLKELEGDGAHDSSSSSSGFFRTKWQMKVEDRFKKERQVLAGSSIGELNVIKRLLAKAKESSM